VVRDAETAKKQASGPKSKTVRMDLNPHSEPLTSAGQLSALKRGAQGVLEGIAAQCAHTWINISYIS
jgi:hypothetical protein